MEMLSYDLKQEVQVEIYKSLLMGCKILSQNFSGKFLEELCSKMQTKKYNPSETIFQTNDIANKLIFILSGEVKIYSLEYYRFWTLQNLYSTIAYFWRMFPLLICKSTSYFKSSLIILANQRSHQSLATTCSFLMAHHRSLLIVHHLYFQECL